MKIFKFIGIITIAIISIGYNNDIVLSSGSSNCSQDCKQNNPRATKSIYNENIMKKSVAFSKDKVVEVAFISLKPGMEKQFNDYFMQAVPIGGEYDAKPLVSFAVIESLHGKINSQMVSLFEWPSIAAKNKFEKDKRIQKLGQKRDDAVSYLHRGFFKVADDAIITFNQNKIYEFFSAWLIADKKEDLNNYFSKVGASIKASGAKRLLKLTPLKARDGEYNPHIAGIVEWPNQMAYFDLVTSKVYRSAVYLRNNATDRIDMLHTKLLIN